MELSNTQDFTTTKDHRKMNKKRECNYYGDFISELPDEVIHQILSFLDMRYVVKTSFLSRRWRNLWKSLPFLNFNAEIFNAAIIHPHPCRDFDDFVTKVLSLHNGTNIHTFRLVLEDPHWDTSSIDTWMTVVVRSNIEVLDIIGNSYGSPLESPPCSPLESPPCIFFFWKVPPCIFNCKSLTMLKLYMGEIPSAVVSWKLPDSASLPNLKTLHLIHFCFYDGDDAEKFISRCPVLETLIMSECMLLRYNDVTLLTISAPQLKNFELDHLYLGKPYYPPHPVSSKLKVCTPNLTWLRYKDFTFNVNFLDMPYLVKAEICTGLDVQMPEVLEQEIGSVMRCFRQLYNIRSLTVNVPLIELVCSARDGSENWITPFCNLRFLNLSTTFSRCHSCAIAYLLNNCPIVETLVLEMREYSSCIKYTQAIMQKVKEDSTEDVECCKAKMPSQCMLRNLRFVEVHKLRGYERELEFLKFLLNNATVLEKMSIYTYDSYSQTSLARLRGFNQKLLAFPRASNIEIIVC